jgi:hypothetical protein
LTRSSHDKQRVLGRSPQPLLCAGAVLLAGLCLAACGSSGSPTNATSTAAAARSSAAPGGESRAKLTACLAKEGIKLPSRPQGKPKGNGGGTPPGGGFKAPGGVSASRYREALKKCGAGSFPGQRALTASAKASLTKYVACMGEAGIDLPEANTSGNGPVFDTSKVSTTSAKFKAAQRKCQSVLKGGFAGGGGPGGGAPTGGSPPAGAGAPGQGGGEAEQVG